MTLFLFQFASIPKAARLAFLTWAKSLSGVEQQLATGPSPIPPIPLSLSENRDYLKSRNMYSDYGSSKVKLDDLLKMTRSDHLLRPVRDLDECLSRVLALGKLFSGIRMNMNFLSNGFSGAHEPAYRSIFPSGAIPANATPTNYGDALYDRLTSFDPADTSKFF